jgi:AraC-like DNA-binding protein/mannose-6-phosphate isomerase-like protein (cupin superfamily)
MRDAAARLTVTRVRLAVYQEKSSRYAFSGERHARLYEIFCLDRGRAEVTTEGRHFDARPGDAFLYWPGHFHRHQAAGGEAPHYVTVAFEATGAQALRALVGQRWPLPTALRSLLSRVVAEEPHALGAEAMRRAHLTELLVAWLRLAHAEARPPRRQAEPVYQERAAGRAVARAMDFIEARYASAGSLEDAARAAGVSPAHLRRLVRDLGGRTLRETRRRLRIAHAKHLLSRSGANVKVVAGKVGYRDVAAFCRAFRAVEGTSPAAYARSVAARGPTPWR